MRFPSLDIIVQYGIYTVKELERFSKGLVAKKQIHIEVWNLLAVWWVSAGTF